jgi:hypothetical protein
MKFCSALACLALALAATPAEADDCQLKMFASLDVVESGGGLIVPVTLQGQSGSYMTLGLNEIATGVTEDVARKFDLRRDSIPQNVWINIAGEAIHQRAEINIQLGGSKGDANVAIIPKYSASDPRVVGMLALDVLNQFDIELDLAHGKLNLFSPDHCKGQVVYWTKTAPVAAVPMTLRGRMEFVVPMQLDGKDVNAELSTVGGAMLNGIVAHDTFGLDNADGEHTFAMLAVDGLGIAHPKLAIYNDLSGGCNGGAKQKNVPLTSEHDVVNPFQRCYGHPDLQLGLQQLKHLRIFIAYRERMVYATAASAN